MMGPYDTSRPVNLRDTSTGNEYENLSPSEAEWLAERLNSGESSAEQYDYGHD